ncbi:MAG TPA: hydrogenase maturation protease [Candidatus Angelobacter sp.]
MNEWEWQLLEDKNVLDYVEIGGVDVRAGDRVRLKPHKGGDVMDIALAGQVATIEAIEQDYEGKQHICVVLDDDPGRDLGLMRQPGHRFFFGPSEVEPLPKTESEPQRAKQKPRILIAGIGNIFLGDDAFGVEVIKRLATRKLPETVRVTDFGIRGFDLVYALQDGYETTILVDASPQGQLPGTVFVMEPDLNSPGSSEQQSVVETHGMNPMNVIRMAKAMNVPLKRLLVVGCEPETLGGAEGHMGLSVTVQAALDEAVNVIENVVNRILDGSWQDSNS